MQGLGEPEVEAPQVPQEEEAPPGPASGEVSTQEEEPERVSAFELVRRIIVGLVQAVENGAELVSTSLREELAGFRTDIERRLVGILLLVVGGGLATGGVALLLHQWIGSWPPVLLLLAVVFVGPGIWLLSSRRPSEGSQ
jgi:hypothetical protein